MTFQLRRKRQTTVWNTTPAKARSQFARAWNVSGIPVVVLVAGLLFGSTAAEFAAADEMTSTGSQGSKLKWLPHRPSDPADRTSTPITNRKPARTGHIVATQWTAQAPAAQAPTEQVPSERVAPKSPFEDPFGDGQSHDGQSHDGRGPAEPGPLFAQSNVMLLQQEPVAPQVERSAAPQTAPSTIDPDPNVLPNDQAYPTDSTDREQVERERPATIPSVESGKLTSEVVAEKCPDRGDTEFFTPIHELTTDTHIKAATEKGVSLEEPEECPLSKETLDPHCLRNWDPTTFTWKASGLCHQPLYFEDVQLERYGHSHGPYIQPIISGAHFFLTIPTLPYQMAGCPPKECMYTLGYYRPGNCAPYTIDPLPLSIRAALAEGGVWTAAVFLIP